MNTVRRSMVSTHNRLRLDEALVFGMAVLFFVAIGNISAYAWSARVSASATDLAGTTVSRQQTIPDATGSTSVAVDIGDVFSSRGGSAVASAAASFDLATGILRGGASANGSRNPDVLFDVKFGALISEQVRFTWADGDPTKNITAVILVHGIAGRGTSENITDSPNALNALTILSGQETLILGQHIAGRSYISGELLGCSTCPNPIDTSPLSLTVTVSNGETLEYRTTISGYVRAMGNSFSYLSLFDTIRLSLVVPDGVTYTSTSGVFLTKASIPITRVGLDQTVNVGTVVTLDGSASSDPSGNPLTYTWTQVAGPIVVLNLGDPAHPTFTAPNVPLGGETLTFQLVVSTGSQTSAPLTTNVTVKYVNHPPVAHAGPNQTVGAGADVTLDGSASYDPDGDVLTYHWTQTGGPPVTLSSTTAMKPTFTAPPVNSGSVTLSFQLVVSDGALSSTALVSITDEHVNHPPVANAGPNQTVHDAKLVTLDGSLSSDPDHDPLTYAWTQQSGIPVTLSDPGAAKPTFTAPLVSTTGDTLVFQLTVTDSGQLISTATTRVTVMHQNPVCTAAEAKPSVLWPPNHKLIPVKIIGVSDPEDLSTTITVTAVTQDEPVRGLGDGDMSPDAVVQGQGVLLRAERSGRNNGRVYVVTFTAADKLGGSCQGTVTVTVPHDRHSDDVDSRNVKIIDDGQAYNALQQ